MARGAQIKIPNSYGDANDLHIAAWRIFGSTHSDMCSREFGVSHHVIK